MTLFVLCRLCRLHVNKPYKMFPAGDPLPNDNHWLICVDSEKGIWNISA